MAAIACLQSYQVNVPIQAPTRMSALAGSSGIVGSSYDSRQGFYRGLVLMMTRITKRTLALFVVALLLCTEGLSLCRAAELLISDRTRNAVYRYGTGGNFLGTLLTDSVNLNAPSGLAL